MLLTGTSLDVVSKSHARSSSQALKEADNPSLLDIANSDSAALFFSGSSETR